MTSREAKEILILYRPGTADTDDPAFGEALRLAAQERDLKDWFDRHCASYTALRAKFKGIPVPKALKEQIIAERKALTTPFWRTRVFLATVAVVAVLTATVSLWLRPREASDLNAYLNRMAKFATRGYGMDVESADPAQVRSYLARQQAPADYALPGALEKAPLSGCAVLGWRGAKVSMLCFRSGKPLPPGQPSDLWLFVVDRAAVSNGPATTEPRFLNLSQLATASWSAGGKTYVLAIQGTEQDLRRFL